MEPARRSGRVAILASAEEARRQAEEERQRQAEAERLEEEALAEARALARQEREETRRKLFRDQEHEIGLTERRLKTIVGETRKRWRANELKEQAQFEQDLRAFEAAALAYKRNGTLPKESAAEENAQEEPKEEEPKEEATKEETVVEGTKEEEGLPASILAMRPKDPFTTSDAWPAMDTVADLGNEPIHWNLPFLMADQITTKWLVDGEGKNMMDRRVRKEGAAALGDRAKLWRSRENVENPSFTKWSDIVWPNPEQTPFEEMRTWPLMKEKWSTF